MKNKLLLIVLLSWSFQLWANNAKYLGESAVIQDAVQQELIAASIETLVVQDCSVASKIEQTTMKSIGKGVEVNYSIPIAFNHPPAGRVTNVNKVIIRLWDNAEQSMGMDIYAFRGDDVYLLGKYRSLAYPIINMIMQPMPPNKR